MGTGMMPEIRGFLQEHHSLMYISFATVATVTVASHQFPSCFVVSSTREHCISIVRLKFQHALERLNASTVVLISTLITDQSIVKDDLGLANTLSTGLIKPIDVMLPKRRIQHRRRSVKDKECLQNTPRAPRQRGAADTASEQRDEHEVRYGHGPCPGPPGGDESLELCILSSWVTGRERVRRALSSRDSNSSTIAEAVADFPESAAALADGVAIKQQTVEMVKFCLLRGPGRGDAAARPGRGTLGAAVAAPAASASSENTSSGCVAAPWPSPSRVARATVRALRESRPGSQRPL